MPTDESIRERLLHLARGGEHEAARRLWTLAERAGDRELAAEAAAVVGDPAQCVDLAAAMWAAGRLELTERLSRRLGFVVDARVAPKLEPLLVPAANDADAAPLTHVDISQCLFEARTAPPGFAFVRAAPSTPGERQRRMACLALRDGNHLKVASAPCVDWNETPEGAWPSLSPWDRLAPGGEANKRKLRQWARAKGQARMRVAVVDAQMADEVRSALKALLSSPSVEQRQLMETLARESVEQGTNGEFDFVSEWLGYLPFGMYCWLEVGAKTRVEVDGGGHFDSADLDRLEKLGFVVELSQQITSPTGDDTRTRYRLTEKAYQALRGGK